MLGSYMHVMGFQPPSHKVSLTPLYQVWLVVLGWSKAECTCSSNYQLAVVTLCAPQGPLPSLSATSNPSFSVYEQSHI